MTLGDLLGNATAETPLVVLIAGALLSAAVWIGTRVWSSIRRQGARVGTVEKVLGLERTRRRQLEQVLREAGVPLPYWPGDPPELYRPAPRDVDDVDQAVDVPDTRFITPEERAKYARHAR